MSRFGKTISVSMFAAALLYSASAVELSIYSTCKRISQKLLRNVMKFLSLVHEGLGTPEFKEIRCNMEELVLQGPDGTSDVRIVNSYPSKASQVLTERFLAVLKCLMSSVFFLNVSHSTFAFWKCSARYTSDSSCNASMASALHSTGLSPSKARFWEISRTSRSKLALGIAGVRFEEERVLRAIS